MQWFKNSEKKCTCKLNIFSSRNPTHQDINCGPYILWINRKENTFWMRNAMDTEWIKLIIDQPERSKREDSKYCCEILEKLKYIFKDDRLLIDVKKYVNDLIVDCEMRCSEHCGNTVSPK